MVSDDRDEATVSIHTLALRSVCILGTIGSTTYCMGVI